MASFIDVRGGGDPWLGRLRGVTARHEIRRVLGVGGDTIYFDPHDAHMRFRKPAPDPLPDALTNGERQLVVKKRVADALAELGVKLKLVPVRLVDAAGATVSEDYVLAAVKKVINCLEFEGDSIGGYIMGSVKRPKQPK